MTLLRKWCTTEKKNLATSGSMAPQVQGLGPDVNRLRERNGGDESEPGLETREPEDTAAPLDDAICPAMMPEL